MKIYMGLISAFTLIIQASLANAGTLSCEKNDGPIHPIRTSSVDFYGGGNQPLHIFYSDEIGSSVAHFASRLGLLGTYAKYMEITTRTYGCPLVERRSLNSTELTSIDLKCDLSSERAFIVFRDKIGTEMARTDLDAGEISIVHTPTNDRDTEELHIRLGRGIFTADETLESILGECRYSPR